MHHSTNKSILIAAVALLMPVSTILASKTEVTVQQTPDNNLTSQDLLITAMEEAPEEMLESIAELINKNCPVVWTPSMNLDKLSLTDRFVVFNFLVTDKDMKREMIADMRPILEQTVIFEGNNPSEESDLFQIYYLARKTKRGIAYIYTSPLWKEPLVIEIPYETIWTAPEE